MHDSIYPYPTCQAVTPATIWPTDDDAATCLADLQISIIGDTQYSVIYTRSLDTRQIGRIANISYLGRKRLISIAGLERVRQHIRRGRGCRREPHRYTTEMAKLAIAWIAATSPRVDERCMRAIMSSDGYVCKACSGAWRDACRRRKWPSDAFPTSRGPHEVHG